MYSLCQHLKRTANWWAHSQRCASDIAANARFYVVVWLALAIDFAFDCIVLAVLDQPHNIHQSRSRNSNKYVLHRLADLWPQIRRGNFSTVQHWSMYCTCLVAWTVVFFCHFSVCRHRLHEICMDAIWIQQELRHSSMLDLILMMLLLLLWRNAKHALI